MQKFNNIKSFDYSKFKTPLDHLWNSEDLRNRNFWGIYDINGQQVIDIDRYKLICESVGGNEFIPKEIEELSGIFTANKKEKYDYKINIFRDLIRDLQTDWEEEYKPIFKTIKTPKEVEDDNRLGALAYTSCSDDYDEICIEAQMAGFKRINQYNKIINSLYCQFISKICTEIDRYTLIVMMELGYKGTDFDFDSFCKFTDGIIKDKSASKLNKLSKYNAYNMLHKINNFLKHNSIQSYNTLKKLYPDNVVLGDYKNGMFAGDWIIIKDGYIDSIFKKLIVFFEDYCKVFLNEDPDISKWDYFDFFEDAFYEMCDLNEYYGLY